MAPMGLMGGEKGGKSDENLNEDNISSGTNSAKILRLSS
jgi:hypothetical protein